MTVYLKREDGVREIETNVDKVITLDDGRIKVVVESERWMGISTVYRKGTVIERVEA